jgi:probable rRNA maturation factor
VAIRFQVAPEFARFVPRARLNAVARKALAAEGYDKRSGLAIVIVGDEELRALNRRYHGVDGPTDVLSFGSPEDEHLGDIFISYETARSNARRAGWRVQDELELLVIHGILHLTGYDDTTAQKRRKMWERQAEILGGKIAQL